MCVAWWEIQSLSVLFYFNLTSSLPPRGNRPPPPPRHCLSSLTGNSCWRTRSESALHYIAGYHTRAAMNLIMPFHPLKQSWYGWFSPFESTMHVLMTNIFLVTPTLAGISEDFGRCLCPSVGKVFKPRKIHAQNNTEVYLRRNSR